MTSSEDRAQHLMQKLVNYHLLFRKCSDQIKQHSLAEITEIYDEAKHEWESNTSKCLVQPPPEDQVKNDAYIAICDSICALEPHNLHEYVLN